MGLLRGLGKFFGSILFTTFLVLAIMMMELVSFTSHDSLKSFASGIFEKQLFSSISEQDFGDLQNFLLFQCSQIDRVNLPLSGGQQVVLRCEDVRNSDKPQLKNLIIGALVDGVYYKDYTCSFVECLTQGSMQDLLVVVSNEGNQFYKSSQTYMWIGAGIGLVVLLVSIQTWSGRLKGVGFNLVSTGLPFLFLGYVQSYFIPSLPPELESSIMPAINDLTESIKNKFIVVLVIGIVLVLAGYALGFYLSRRNKK